MLRSDFTYDLPRELIAQYPSEHRGDNRLLRLNRRGGEPSHHRFTDLLTMLSPGDLLVFNDTRVIPARLYGSKQSGGRVEVLLERLLGSDSMLAQINASKPPRQGTRILLESGSVLEVAARRGSFYLLKTVDDCVTELLELFLQSGHVPLPPYIRRQDDGLDRDRYQTLYAREYGAVAAPTAGLHFTREILDGLSEKGIGTAFITLHVGAGTFQPLRVEEISDHRMHGEWFRISKEACHAIEETRRNGGRVVAVGTTTVRALETTAESGDIKPGEYETEIFIYPGYEFRVIDAMITNFHLPESTLLMLVCAFAGRENVMNAYEHAIRERYRFYSYGDAMFISY